MRHQRHDKDIFEPNSYDKGTRTPRKASGPKRRCHQFMPGAIGRFAMVLMVAVALGLSACGGGGGRGPPPGATPHRRRAGP
ncbi:MAG: hypothetical protein ACE5LB_12990, partial [Acidiferrobacterales bacterium]